MPLETQPLRQKENHPGRHRQIFAKRKCIVKSSVITPTNFTDNLHDEYPEGHCEADYSEKQGPAFLPLLSKEYKVVETYNEQHTKHHLSPENLIPFASVDI